ncbi:hypothetical protein BDQ17DRAFT_1436053 [Cyathus striatus]|nr:hypothetical protein BDQ17DRAFT_1436053 [Cyathus striatus]
MPYTLASSTASGLSNTASPLALAAVSKFLQHTEEPPVLPAEKCNETGELETRYKPRIPIKSRKPKTKGRKEPEAASDTDLNDIEFLPPLMEDSDSEGEDKEEDNIDDVIGNEEIAASLPTKLSSKRKQTQSTSKTHTTKKTHRIVLLAT